MSLDVNFRASAAFSLCSQLLQSIEEQDSGEITEYQVFSNINISSPTPIPKHLQKHLPNYDYNYWNR